jgi:hypothetical protein
MCQGRVGDFTILYLIPRMIPITSRSLLPDNVLNERDTHLWSWRDRRLLGTLANNLNTRIMAAVARHILSGTGISNVVSLLVTGELT